MNEIVVEVDSGIWILLGEIFTSSHALTTIKAQMLSGLLYFVE